MALSLIRNPWNWDVMITENMFGDILSDAAAALMGGMGMAPSADIGDKHALFQPCHGTAPDIMGTGKANPTAMLLSGAMMLDWLGETHNDDALAEAGERLRQAVRAAFADGELVPCEVGGTAGLKQVTDRVLDALKA
jgi:3-isopropylmalate dehydrogenase